VIQVDSLAEVLRSCSVISLCLYVMSRSNTQDQLVSNLHVNLKN